MISVSGSGVGPAAGVVKRSGGIKNTAAFCLRPWRPVCLIFLGGNMKNTNPGYYNEIELDRGVQLSIVSYDRTQRALVTAGGPAWAGASNTPP